MRLRKQKLIRMNMPVDDKGTVHFTTTLFALIRESLSIRMGPGTYLQGLFIGGGGLRHHPLFGGEKMYATNI